MIPTMKKRGSTLLGVKIGLFAVSARAMYGEKVSSLTARLSSVVAGKQYLESHIRPAESDKKALPTCWSFIPGFFVAITVTPTLLFSKRLRLIHLGMGHVWPDTRSVE